MAFAYKFPKRGRKNNKLESELYESESKITTESPRASSMNPHTSSSFKAKMESFKYYQPTHKHLAGERRS